MAKTINGFSEGIGSSPLTGFGNIRNLDISSVEGAVSPNLALVADGTATITGRPIAMIEFDSKAYMVDGDNTLWWRGGSDPNFWASRATSFASGKLALWRDYIIGGLTTSIHVCDNLGNESDFGTLTTATKQMAIVLSDAVYIVGGNAVSKLTENVGETFDPSVPSTFTVEQDKLLLNSGAIATCCTTWNGFLIIGDDQGNLYKWNGVSDLPADITKTTESTVQRLITVNRLVYAQIGNSGDWYYYDGVRVELVKEMPDYLFDFRSDKVVLESEGVAEVNNKIFFAMDVVNRSGNVGGIYSLDYNTGALQCEDEVTGGTDENITHGALLAEGFNQYYAGWEKAGGTDTYGIDLKSTTAHYTGDKAYLETAYSIISTGHESVTYSKPFLLFSKPLVSSDSIKIYYRDNLLKTGGDSDGYTLHQTIPYSATESVQRKGLNSLPPLKEIQNKVVINNTAQLTNIILQ